MVGGVNLRNAMKLKPTLVILGMITSYILSAGQPLNLPVDKLPKPDEGVKLVPASELMDSAGVNEIKEQLSKGYINKKTMIAIK